MSLNDLLGFFMSRIMYFGMIALPIFMWYLGQNVASRNLSILNQDIPNVASFSTKVESGRVQLKPYLIAGRNEKPDTCMQLGSCKN
jgi:hypothetical protein